MSKRLIVKTTLSIGLLLASALLYGQEIRIQIISDQRDQLVLDLLELALSKSDSNYHVIEQKYDENEARTTAHLMNGKVDLIWAGASPDKEEKLRAIYFPISRGLLGYRIFLIRSGDQQRFSKITNLNDLMRLSAGQGVFWGDTRILKSANLPVETTVQYANLFKMLAAERFDYFPRAIYEPWEELDKYSHHQLAVEQELLLYYPYAMYFYVHRNNQKLHDDLYTGLMLATEDGSYNEMLFNDPLLKQILSKTNIPKRRIMTIDNPYLAEELDRSNPALWVSYEQLVEISKK